MINAWIIVREEKHLDTAFWVHLDKKTALRIAADVVAYWRGQYDLEENFIDETLYGDQIFHFDAEDAFRVYVQPQQILENSETLNPSCEL